ncbi:3D domain-containing protein [Sporosarcina beigongshangi]|uniref:3D domain-containing protein n=1 Tax=Sporosarcina beigongshangi TaxID=2782538 RepID=UPI001BA8348A|nr:3D domain-containing protein [Sporosarcina beigongshangi]
MLRKIKIFLLALFFVGFTYSVAQASVLSTSFEGEEYTFSHYFPDGIDSQESEVPFQDYLLADAPVKLQPDPEVYTVNEGDNLYRIALNHDISLTSLMTLNGLTGSLIHPGDELIVSGGEGGTVELAKDVVPSSTPQVAVSAPPPSVSEGEELLVTATAYTAYCEGCSGTTAYGIDLRANPNRRVIAVDPRVIPLGTKVWVEGYGEAIAGDTGGAIKGHKIDVFIPSYDQAMEWGVKKVKMRVLN